MLLLTVAYSTMLAFETLLGCMVVNFRVVLINNNFSMYQRSRSKVPQIPELANRKKSPVHQYNLLSRSPPSTDSGTRYPEDSKYSKR